MKISTEKDYIILKPEGDYDIFELGKWTNKIPISIEIVRDGTYNENKITVAKVEIQHILTFLRKEK